MTVITDNQHYTNIANAIRNKLNTQTAYTPAQMANAILQINTSGSDSGSGLTEYLLLATPLFYLQTQLIKLTLPT